MLGLCFKDGKVTHLRWYGAEGGALCDRCKEPSPEADSETSLLWSDRGDVEGDGWFPRAAGYVLTCLEAGRNFGNASNHFASLR